MLRRRLVRSLNVVARPVGTVLSALNQLTNARANRVITGVFVSPDQAGFDACAQKDSPDLIAGST